MGCHEEGMPMAFYFGYVNEVLFKGLSGKNPATLVFICIGFACLTCLEQLMKIVDRKIYARTQLSKKYLSSSYQPTTSDDNADDVTKQKSRSIASTMSNPILFQWIGWHFFNSFFFTLRFFVAYLVMLAAMSFNGYIFISIMLGAFIGHFIAYTLFDPAQAPVAEASCCC